MELNKTKCRSCGHVHEWHSYKWADTEERREHNRRNAAECPKCRSLNVENVEDDETMAVAQAAASAVTGLTDTKASAIDRYVYTVRWSAEDELFIGTVAELPNLMSYAASADGALQQARLAARTLAGDDPPEPFAERPYSGKFVVRVPRSLHRRLAVDAQNEGVSLNQWILMKLASA